ncbi:MAG: hypothetical protein JHC33_06580 [Ignisphaera sp.]|jgi:hypothetical protein|nr:hypothetical protein [Ignisphaera sp.]
MISSILPDITIASNSWLQVTLPDKIRDSIKFQALSLGILEYSFDGGVTYMRTVGSGEQLRDNFSNQNIWFRTPSADTIKIMIVDKGL